MGYLRSVEIDVKKEKVLTVKFNLFKDYLIEIEKKTPQYNALLSKYKQKLIEKIEEDATQKLEQGEKYGSQMIYIGNINEEDLYFQFVWMLKNQDEQIETNNNTENDLQELPIEIEESEFVDVDFNIEVQTEQSEIEDFGLRVQPDVVADILIDEIGLEIQDNPEKNSDSRYFTLGTVKYFVSWRRL